VRRLSHPAVEIAGLCKSFTRERRALEIDGLKVWPGEMVALIGASGSGKSTLLQHVAGLMLDPIVWRKDLPDDQKAKVRAFFLTYGTDRPGADVAHERKVLADLYRFESNVRSASVIGLVGAGGIGQMLWEIIRAFRSQQACAIMLVIVAAVTLIDAASQQLRRAFI